MPICARQQRTARLDMAANLAWQHSGAKRGRFEIRSPEATQASTFRLHASSRFHRRALKLWSVPFAGVSAVSHTLSFLDLPTSRKERGDIHKKAVRDVAMTMVEALQEQTRRILCQAEAWTLSFDEEGLGGCSTLMQAWLRSFRQQLEEDCCPQARDAGC